jgi:hypothetical protein
MNAYELYKVLFWLLMELFRANLGEEQILLYCISSFFCASAERYEEVRVRGGKARQFLDVSSNSSRIVSFTPQLPYPRTLMYVTKKAGLASKPVWFWCLCWERISGAELTPKKFRVCSSIAFIRMTLYYPTSSCQCILSYLSICSKRMILPWVRLWQARTGVNSRNDSTGD